jgi:tetratricopeptide (TPR) repeat protein
VYANVIRPSTSDIARYRFRVPQNAAGQQLELRAQLKWRKFNRTFTEFVYEGKTVPDLPITVIGQSDVRLEVAANPAPGREPPDLPDDWKRYNDYGVGLFLDEDTRGALAMFQKVAQLQPSLFDGWLNQARAYLADGSLAKAEDMLRKASAAAENQPRVAFFWGQVLERSGRLSEAVQAYRATLQAYPKSRDTWARLGRTYWLLGRAQDSIEAYLQVLDIDPEHAQSYHQLSLAYKALAGAERNADRRRKYAHAAAETAKAFEKYKLDENAPKVTQRYRDLHPYDNRMSQTIVVHAQEGL